MLGRCVRAAVKVKVYLWWGEWSGLVPVGLGGGAEASRRALGLGVPSPCPDRPTVSPRPLLDTRAESQ